MIELFFKLIEYFIPQGIELDILIYNYDLLNNIHYNMSNNEINKIIYEMNNIKYKKQPFFFKEFSEKAEKGLNNLNKFNLDTIEVFEEKIWVRNNYRDYNFNIIEELSKNYFLKTKFVYSDYIYHNLFFKKTMYIFNENGSININFLFSRNYLSYHLPKSYLKELLILKNNNDLSKLIAHL